ncbi:hypothetical protein Zmor_013354 [Zophobas morio]|uniref:Uncharacterized protein n=1 Tax=Zophobas morio TaxID=2755281 RepID=A0AA38MF94_9CUCU|nr:hypothetical protein Zmor_013354 [Zophobas morio]
MSLATGYKNKALITSSFMKENVNSLRSAPIIEKIQTKLDRSRAPAAQAATIHHLRKSSPRNRHFSFRFAPNKTLPTSPSPTHHVGRWPHAGPKRHHRTPANITQHAQTPTNTRKSAESQKCATSD